MQRKDGGQPTPGTSSGTADLDQPWFTVAEAARLLEVSPTRIFDGIRDGKLRVRFRAAAEGQTERPLVHSAELVQRARARSAGAADGEGEAKPMKQPAASKSPEPPVPGSSPPDKPEPAPAVEGTKGRSASKKPASQTESAKSSKKPAKGAPTQRPEEAAVAESPNSRLAPAGVSAEQWSDVLVARKLAEERLDSERQRLAKIDDSLQEFRRKLQEAEQDRQSLVGSLQENKRRANELDKELESARTALEQSEDQVEASLKAVYERDVKIARLESEVKAVEQIKATNEEMVQKLQDRLVAAEDRNEEKEREIRRLALGLGEARGEIRLLRPPVEIDPPGRERWKRVRPWLLVAGLAAVALWLAYALATSGRGIEAGVIAAVGLLAAFAGGRWLETKRK